MNFVKMKLKTQSINSLNKRKDFIKLPKILATWKPSAKEVKTLNQINTVNSILDELSLGKHLAILYDIQFRQLLSFSLSYKIQNIKILI